MERIVASLPVATARRIVKKDTTLLCQGDEPNQVHFVVSGSVKVSRVGYNGEEQVVGFKTAGDLFPEPWAFGRTAITIYNYKAVEVSEIALMDKDAFAQYLTQNPSVKDACFDYMLKNFMGAMLQVTALGQSYATDKLTLVLYYLMLRYGKEKEPDEYWVTVKLSHGTIASLTGLSRETVTTELGRLRRKGIIEYESGKLMIRRSVLLDKINDSGFTDSWLWPTEEK